MRSARQFGTPDPSARVAAMPGHRKTGATTSEGHGKPPPRPLPRPPPQPPYRSRPLSAEGRQKTLTMPGIARGFLPTRRKADTISMGLDH